MTPGSTIDADPAAGSELAASTTLRANADPTDTSRELCAVCRHREIPGQNDRYCSRACYLYHCGPTTPITCSWCGTETERIPHDGNRPFCSPHCQHAAATLRVNSDTDDEFERTLRCAGCRLRTDRTEAITIDIDDVDGPIGLVGRLPDDDPEIVRCCSRACADELGKWADRPTDFDDLVAAIAQEEDAIDPIHRRVNVVRLRRPPHGRVDRETVRERLIELGEHDPQTSLAAQLENGEITLEDVGLSPMLEDRDPLADTGSDATDADTGGEGDE